jgi:hypothetical protein
MSAYVYDDSTPFIHDLEPDSPRLPAPRDPRVLLFSQRFLDRPVWQGAMYEFEDIIAEVDAVQMLAPRRHHASVGTRLRRRLAAEARRRLGLPPAEEPIELREADSALIRIDSDYDLFCAIFHFVWQAAYLSQLRNWRRRCRKAVCFILEQWLTRVETNRRFLEMLSEFDQIFVFGRWCIPEIEALTGKPVHYMASGADTKSSFPLLGPARRPIDFYSIGRRLPALHESLLRLAQEQGCTYVFDSVEVGSIPSIDYKEHRDQVRHLLNRSRYFVVFRHNDSPQFRERTGGEEQLSVRFFEGIAGGPVLIGSHPDCEDYRTHFDWPDATIVVPDRERSVEQTLSELEAQPERLAQARRNNVVNALRRHDWVHRWRTMLDSVDLPPTAGMARRTAELDQLAQRAEAHRWVEPSRG